MVTRLAAAAALLLVAASPAPAGETLVLLKSGAVRDAGAWASSAVLGLRAAAPAPGSGSVVSPATLRSVAPAVSSAYGLLWLVEGELSPAQRELLQGDEAVAYVGPNRFIPIEPLEPGPPPQAPGAQGPGGSSTAEPQVEFPDDLLYPNQQAIKAVRAPQAWSTATGKGILIAIVDTGVDLDHPDLAANIYLNPAEAAGEPGVDDDGNGYVDDVRGYDFTDAPSFPGAGDYLDRDPDASDEDGHGTAVAGVAAAVWNNGVGIVGVAPEAKILPVRSGMRTSMPFVPALLQEDDAAAAIIYAADQGAHIINCSWGDVLDSPVIRAAVQYAQDRGALVVASAGNSPRDRPHFPSGYSQVIGVGATDFQGRPTSFSAFGQDLDLAAPGYLVLGPVLNGGWVTFSGTSLSAPLTSGVLALAWSAHPQWNAAQVAWQVMDTARRSGDWTEATGWGLADAERAVVSTPGDVFALELHDVVPVLSDAQDAGPITWRITGDVLGAELVGWRLRAQSVDSGETRELTPYQTQPASGVLGEWTRDADDRDDWVVILDADFGAVNRERRQRLYLPAALVADDVAHHFQAGLEGWDLVVQWDSEYRYQGAAWLTGAPGHPPRWREEAALSRDHALRFSRLPADLHHLTVSGRAPGRDAFSYVYERARLAPPAPAPARQDRFSDLVLPPGSLLSKQTDLDGDGRPELILEEELDPEGAQYGPVRFVELTQDLTGVTGEGATMDYQGIPLDVAPLIAPDRIDLLSFRLDAWSVYRSPGPGEYPTELVYTGDPSSLPLGFVSEPAGLLSVSEQTLSFHDPAGEVVWQVDTDGDPLVRQGVWGDFDGDGLLEAFVSDRLGRVVAFRVTATGGALLGTYSQPLVGRNLLRAGNTLVVTSQTPNSLQEGGVEALGMEISQWIWSVEDGLEPVASRVMSGRDLRSVAVFDDGLWVQRGHRWDRFSREGDLEWLEALAFVDVEPLPPTVTEGVRVASATREALLVGGLFSGESHLYHLDGHGAPVQGPAGRVVAWEPGASDSLILTVALEPGPCPVVSVERDLAGEVTRIVPGPASFVDTVPGEAEVYYTFLTEEACVPYVLPVRASGSPAPERRWVSSRNLEVRWEHPVPLEQPGRVLVHSEAGWGPPLAVNQGENGALFVITVPASATAVDSVRFESFWNVHGLPLGGGTVSTLSVPRAPVDAALYIHDVEYRPDLLELWVTFDGGEACGTPEFTLTPGNLVLTGAPGNPVRISLGNALEAGVYRLEYTGGCAQVHPGGTQARFTVGVLAYPNPVGEERLLWVSNLPPDTELELVDAAGRSVRTFSREDMPLDLEGLASGLYLLRIQPPGRSASWKKIGVR